MALSDEAIREHWGIPYEALFRALFGHVEPAVARAIHYYEAVDDEFPIEPYPEALELLEALRGRVSVGIVTSAGRSMVTVQLARIGVRPADLAILQTEEDTAYHKPDPRVFEPALTTLAERGIRAAEVLYVGDSLRDYQAARGAGLQFRGVLRGTTTRAEFEAGGARCDESLRSLLALIPPASAPRK